MLIPASATRVFVALTPVDLRGSFNRLFALTQNVLRQDPLSGHWFVFTNRQRNRLKILFWDGSGLWCCAKRLERGKFSWPLGSEACTPLHPGELEALVSGLVVSGRKDWHRVEPPPAR